MPPRPIYEIPEERIEPEILALMTIPILKVAPQDFEPHIKEEDLEDENFDKRDRKILLAMSVVTQQQDFIFYAARLNNYYARQQEAVSIRARKYLERKIEDIEERGKLNWMEILKKALAYALASGLGALLVHHMKP